MKNLCILALVAPCLGHPQRAAFLEQQFKEGAELGAAKIIHNIRGVESLLAKELSGSPKELLVEEQLLHKASQLALKAGKSRARQVHSAEKLTKIETALAQMEQSSGEAHEDTTQETTQETTDTTTEETGEDTTEETTKDTTEETTKETTPKETTPEKQENILEEVHALKTDVADALGKSNPTVTAKLESLMDRVGGAQKDILQSEATAASHASELAADVRKAKTPAAGAFAQASFKESSGSQDPVRRVQLAKQALGQLSAAKLEVAEAYGGDDETAKKVSALMDQLSGSLTGLELGSEEDAKATSFKASEAAMFAKIEAGEAAALAPMKKSGKKAALLQASNALMASTQARRLMKLAQKTSMLASEDHRISKETMVARQMVDKALGNTKVGAEVSALLSKAVSEANSAAAGDRHLAAIEAHQVQNLLAH